VSCKANSTLIPLGDVQDDVTEESIMELHSGQKAVLEDNSKKKLVVVGVQWGKTTLAMEMALQRCLGDHARFVRVYERNQMMIQRCREYLYNRMIELNQKFIQEVGHGVFHFANGSVLTIETFPYTDREELIFDDALDRIQNLTIMFTPVGWHLHQAPSTENPTVVLTDECRYPFSKIQAAQRYDGDLNDEWDRYKEWYTREYGIPPSITRSAFNRFNSEPGGEYEQAARCYRMGPTTPM